ncbi:uncharacterized protein LOC130689366 [Daphnia carinata]|uniref:uncharacterized protein LOC130686946 n=1 Tax=Daphnia carinata TaxID=120202 RepID=UPI0028685877|nr:uncharacterized protein LOC130686946 [Daphnia carinata]XP_059350115.1 uncharacterized protein LOC130689366 [Daphnia carinata]
MAHIITEEGNWTTKYAVGATRIVAQNCHEGAIIAEEDHWTTCFAVGFTRIIAQNGGPHHHKRRCWTSRFDAVATTLSAWGFTTTKKDAGASISSPWMFQEGSIIAEEDY